MVRKDGSVLPVLMSATLVSDADGRYVMSRSTVFDVTDRKQAEERIRLNELRLESMVRIAQYRAHDVQALLDYALDEAITLTGSTVGAIYEHDPERGELRLGAWSMGGARESSATMPRSVHPLQATGLWGEAVRRRRPIVVNDDRAPHPMKPGVPDGQVPIRRLMTVPVLDGDRIVAVIGVANKDSDYDTSDVRQLVLLMDSVWRVVERKHADEVLRQSEQRLNLLIQQTPLAVIEWDTDSRVARWNPAAERVFGYPAAEAIGRHGSFIAPDGGWPLPASDPAGLPALGGGARSILENVTKDGRTILCEWHSTPLTGEDGRPIGVAALASDITELRRAEREMKETLEIKSQFISTVSHELRTPLTAIKESIEIVREETAGMLTADAQDFLDVARRNIDRLARLIHNVLAFQRLEAGSVAFDLRPHDVNDVVREVAAAMSPLAAQKGARARARAGGHAPAGRVRPGPGHAGADQPGRQRHQVQRPRPRAGRHRRARRPVHGDGDGHRVRHRAGGPAPALPEVPAAGTVGREGGRRQRAGPGDLQGDRRASRGQHLGRVGARGRDGGAVRAAHRGGRGLIRRSRGPGAAVTDPGHGAAGRERPRARGRRAPRLMRRGGRSTIGAIAGRAGPSRRPQPWDSLQTPGGSASDLMPQNATVPTASPPARRGGDVLRLLRRLCEAARRTAGVDHAWAGLHGPDGTSFLEACVSGSAARKAWKGAAHPVVAELLHDLAEGRAPRLCELDAHVEVFGMPPGSRLRLVVPIATPHRAHGCLCVGGGGAVPLSSAQEWLVHQLADNLALSYERMLQGRKSSRGRPTISSPPGAEVVRSATAEEERLRRSRRMMEVGRMAGEVAHDFNNQLTTILGHGELVMRKLPAESPLHGHVREMLDAVDRAAGFTRQLQACSHRRAAQPRVLDLNETVSEMVRMLGRVIGGRIRLTTRLAPDLDRLEADAGLLEQVIVNLITDARDTIGGAGRIDVETTRWSSPSATAGRWSPASPASRYALMVVTGTGAGAAQAPGAIGLESAAPGMPPGGRTGIGIDQVRGIVERLGGDLVVEAVPGARTTFRVCLPAIGDVKLAETRTASGDGLPRGTETVLLVEDEPAVRELEAFVLREQGYRVLEVADGQAALELLQGAPDPAPDLLMTDLVMPRLGGRALIDLARRLFPGLRILRISGDPGDVSSEDGLQGATAAFLHKPFTMAELTRKVREVLEAPAG